MTIGQPRPNHRKEQFGYEQAIAGFIDIDNRSLENVQFPGKHVLMDKQ